MIGNLDPGPEHAINLTKHTAIALAEAGLRRKDYEDAGTHNFYHNDSFLVSQFTRKLKTRGNLSLSYGYVKTHPEVEEEGEYSFTRQMPFNCIDISSTFAGEPDYHYVHYYRHVMGHDALFGLSDWDYTHTMGFLLDVSGSLTDMAAEWNESKYSGETFFEWYISEHYSRDNDIKYEKHMKGIFRLYLCFKHVFRIERFKINFTPHRLAVFLRRMQCV